MVMQKSDHLVLRSLGGGMVVLALLAAVQRLRLNAQERYAVAETLRDVADEIEHRHALVQ
jgi:hypothetical protein